MRVTSISVQRVFKLVPELAVTRLANILRGYYVMMTCNVHIGQAKVLKRKTKFEFLRSCII